MEYKILFSTRFVTNNIIEHIIENTNSIIVINSDIYSLTTFVLNDENLENDILDIDKRINFFINIIKPNNQNLPIKIFWFPTKFKKILPLDKKSLDVNEINSACTIHRGSIINSIVVIYRKEEAKKVLFHELVHLFGLDSNIPNNIEYNIRKKYNLNLLLPCSIQETYAEFIGCLLNIYFISKGNDYQFNNYLAIEQAFSLYQLNKILKFYNITNINNLFYLNSNTNLMTYYFLKTALLTHVNVKKYFLSLLRNNLILDFNNLVFFEKYLNNLQNIPRYIKYIQNLYIDDKTMRMTIVE